MADKKLMGLLNGITKRDFYGDTDISNEFLKEQLYPDLPEEDFEVILTQYQNILKNMIYSDMDLNQLDAFLTSIIHKKQNSITEEQKGSIMKFWKANKQKLHDVIVEKVSFNNSLKTFKWRIDVDYKDNSQSSEPKLIFEIGLDKKRDNAVHEKMVFECDGKTLDELIIQTENIEEAISNAMK